jgi:hypothetical protein
MRTTAVALLVLAAHLALAPPAAAQAGGVAQGPPPPQPAPAARPLDRGRIEGSTYTNDYFGLSFTIPAGWSVHDTPSVQQFQQSAKGIFRDEKNPQLKQQFEAVIEKTTTLLSASKFPKGSPEPYNALLICAAERVPTALVKSPEDYYKLMLQSFRLSKEVDVQVVEPFKAKTIGATTFGLFTIKMTFNLGVTVQKHLVMVEGPYALGLVFGYAEEEDVKTFEQVVSSVKATGRRKDKDR